MGSADEQAAPGVCGGDGTSTALSPTVVVSVLASLLERHIARNERRVSGEASAAAEEEDCGRRRKRIAAFDGGTVLDMSLREFLERFSRYAHVSPEVYVVAYAYLDRLRRGDAGGVRVVASNAQRLLTTAILVASKFVEDRNYKNSYFAAVGGLTAAELCSLELDFLFLMQFNLNVHATVFQSYCRHLEREVGHGGGFQVERCLKTTQHRQAPPPPPAGVGGTADGCTQPSSPNVLRSIRALPLYIPKL